MEGPRQCLRDSKGHTLLQASIGACSKYKDGHNSG